MIIRVKVKAGSSKGPLVEMSIGQIIVYVREQAIDGKANSAIVAVLSNYYSVPKSNVKILAGRTRTFKKIDIIYTK